MYSYSREHWLKDQKEEVPRKDLYKSEKKVPSAQKNEKSGPDLKNTRERITDYLLLLKNRKEWGKMREFVKDLTWISQEEKLVIYKNIKDWEDNEKKSSGNGKTPPLKVKIK